MPSCLPARLGRPLDCARGAATRIQQRAVATSTPRPASPAQAYGFSSAATLSSSTSSFGSLGGSLHLLSGAVTSRRAPATSRSPSRPSSASALRTATPSTRLYSSQSPPPPPHSGHVLPPPPAVVTPTQLPPLFELAPAPEHELEPAQPLDSERSAGESAEESTVFHHARVPSGLPEGQRPTMLVLEDPGLVDEAVEYLRSPVGLDIEWVPYIGLPNPTAMLQISDGQTILVIRTLQMLRKCPPKLRAFLEDPNILKVGVGIFPDGEKISVDLGVRCQGLMELNSLREPDSFMRPFRGLAALTEFYTGLSLPKDKRVTCSNWAAHNLSREQVDYAANDAHAAVLIYHALRDEALSTGFRGPPNFSFTSPSATRTTAPRVPDELVQRAHEGLRLVSVTPPGPNLAARRGGSRFKERIVPFSNQTVRALNSSSLGGELLQQLTGGRRWY